MLMVWPGSRRIGHYVARGLGRSERLLPVAATQLRHLGCSPYLYARKGREGPPCEAGGDSTSQHRTARRGQEPQSVKRPRAPGEVGAPSLAAEPQRPDEQIADEERRLVEGDTRLAMRMLMQHYFLYQNNSRRPEDERLEEERRKLREKHRARTERIENKTRNSMELGAGVAVDGILPLYNRRKTTGAEAPASSSWRTPNPVEAEEAAAADTEQAKLTAAEDVDEGDDSYENLNRMCSDLPRGGHLGIFLAKPDITAYDAEHDKRIRSTEVLESEERCRKEELLKGSSATKLWSKEELEAGGGLTPMRVVQSQLLEDEDEDFAVEVYERGADE